jgi:predicted NBD/HSP70 family sugar kinase
LTIVADGKPCVCGNRGCWEQYAAAASAVPQYLNGHQSTQNQTVFRFLDVVRKAEEGEKKAIEVLQNLGKYLGIGIANIFSGIGIPRVIISGRLVYGWKFINQSLVDSVEQSLASKIKGWTVERGEPSGAGLGGAFEIAFNEYIIRDHYLKERYLEPVNGFEPPT